MVRPEPYQALNAFASQRVLRDGILDGQSGDLRFAEAQSPLIGGDRVQLRSINDQEVGG